MSGAAKQQEKKDALKDYITVAERIEQFYQRFPEGRIVTHIVEHDSERGFILIRAEGYRGSDDLLPAATGHAFELRSEGYVNRTSYIENCESSSVGRMLALMGFEVKRGIASREEMDKATRARGHVAMIQGVTYADGKYTVKSNRGSFVVSKGHDGRVGCDCPDFAENFEADPEYRCPDIVAVKEFAAEQKRELEQSAARQQAR